MSFHSSLMAVWPADLVSAGVVTTADAVYVGRQAQEVARRDREVLIERLPDPDTEGSGGQNVIRHAYRLHVRVAANMGGNKAGTAFVTTVDPFLQLIKDRYHGQVRFVATFSGMMPASARENVVDEDPEDKRYIVGSVDVTFNVAE